MSRIFGYGRVSTGEQTVAGQKKAILDRYPHATFHADEGISGTVPATQREKFKAILEFAAPGDTIVVTAIDRIGRNARSVLEVCEKLELRQVSLISLREGFDFGTPTGKMMLTMVSAFAEMELANLKERTKAGMAAAAAEGRYAGRPTKQTPENVGAVIMKHDAGVSAARIARDLGISRGTVNRILQKHAKA
ncbi:recombinase family protein [Citrobacter freundii]|uniref:recombinase family protein n=1 Tax=Citrobacter freundii TaxID=546 RepID=UPI001C7071F2|nr:recombinase family protein [Citrobacter freundii]MBW9593877.1 recombinase family protein [Citrobacter freundii]